MATKYLHTLDGKPAYFDGWQIVFATKFGKAAPMAESLQQIRKEQTLTVRNRERKFGVEKMSFKYEYTRINVKRAT